MVDDITLEIYETLMTCHYESCAVTGWSGRAGSWLRCRCWWWRCSPRASAWISAPYIFSVQINGSNEDSQRFHRNYKMFLKVRLKLIGTNIHSKRARERIKAYIRKSNPDFFFKVNHQWLKIRSHVMIICVAILGQETFHIS